MRWLGNRKSRQVFVASRSLEGSGQSFVNARQSPSIHTIANASHTFGVGRRRDTPDQQAVEKMAILIRADLPITPGRIINIASTIAVRLFQGICATPNTACTRWNSFGQKKVVLKVSGEEQMQKLIQYARKHRIPVAGMRANFVKRTNIPRNHDSRITYSKSTPPPKMSQTWVALGMLAPGHVIDGLTSGLEQYE